MHLGPGGEVVVVSGWGGASDWYRNLAFEQEVEIVVGRRRSRATHRRLAPEEGRTSSPATSAGTGMPARS